MAPEKSPAFQFYPKDYLSDPRVKAMSFEQRGLYWDAICICWLEGTLPADVTELAFILGCPQKRFAALWPRIALCFQEHGGRLTHKRLDKERDAQTESRRRRTDAANKRWEAEHGKSKADAMHVQSNASPVDAKQCSPSSSASSSASPSSTAVNGTPPAPIISGQSNPRDWGRIHGNHTPGFCDWVCLPDFVFEEFRAKSPGPEYVRGWALKVRERYEGQTIGEDGLKFWRARWAESHRLDPVKPKPRGVAEILAERDAAKGRAS